MKLSLNPYPKCRLFNFSVLKISLRKRWVRNLPMIMLKMWLMGDKRARTALNLRPSTTVWPLCSTYINRVLRLLKTTTFRIIMKIRLTSTNFSEKNYASTITRLITICRAVNVWLVRMRLITLRLIDNHLRWLLDSWLKSSTLKSRKYKKKVTYLKKLNSWNQGLLNRQFRGARTLISSSCNMWKEYLNAKKREK